MTPSLLLPPFLLIFAILFSTIPTGIPALQNFYPMFGVMFIYYWGTYKPQMLPYWFVFVVGVLQDTIFGLPLGSNALIYLLLRAYVTVTRKGRLKFFFFQIWKSFIITASMASILQWALYSFLWDQPLPLSSFVIQYALSCILYPLIHRVCFSVHMSLPHGFTDVKYQ